MKQYIHRDMVLINSGGLTVQQQIDKIIKERYNNYTGTQFHNLKGMHRAYRQILGDEGFLEFLKKLETENPKPQFDLAPWPQYTEHTLQIIDNPPKVKTNKYLTPTNIFFTILIIILIILLGEDQKWWHLKQIENMKYRKEIKSRNFEDALALDAAQVKRIKGAIEKAYTQEWDSAGPNVDQINDIVAPYLKTPEEAFYAGVVITSDIFGAMMESGHKFNSNPNVN